MKQLLTRIGSLPRALTLWLVAEERLQVRTFRGGVRNLKAVCSAIDWFVIGLPGRGARAIERAVQHLLRALGHAVLWPFLAAGRGIKRMGRGLRRFGHEIVALARQLRLDLVHALKASARLAAWPFVKAGRLVGHLAWKLLTPVRKPFARSAKRQALNAAPITPDHKSHRELILLVAGVLAIAVALLLVISQSGRETALGLVPLAKLQAAASPSRALARLASASPSMLLGLGAVFSLLTAAGWFWIKMVIDAWRRDYPSHTEKAKWRLYTVLFSVPGAAVYFFRVYNHWPAKRFLSYHFVSVMVTGMVILVGVSTYGSLWYFNKKAEAQVQTGAAGNVPNLNLDAQSKDAVLNRPRYGAPLSPSTSGRVDPFAPIPGQAGPSPSPSPSATPKP